MSQQVKIGWTPHCGTPDFPGGQVRLIALTLIYQTVVAVVGRRWGKTQAAMMAIMEHFRQDKYRNRPFVAAYCGPTYKAALRQFDEALGFFGPLVSHKNRSEGWISLIGVNGNLGGMIHFWSLENYDVLRGARLDFCVVDEAKDVKEDAYANVLRPMLIDTGGHILIIGTPHPNGVGFMWFRREYGFGENSAVGHYASMSGPSEGNPYLCRETLARERALATPLTVASEYDAIFVDDLGAVFENIEQVCSLPFQSFGQDIFEGSKPIPGRRYVISYDIGRHSDPAIITVFDVDRREQVFLWRGREKPFELQLHALMELREAYNDAVIYADANGMGEAVFERLAIQFGDSVIGRKWNRHTKEADIGRAMALFQRKAWRLLAVPFQKQEMHAYTRTKLPAGGFRYEAASGFHDDTVTAACMIAHEMVYKPFEIEEPEPRYNMLGPDNKIRIEYWEEAEEAERLREFLNRHA